MTVTPSFDRGWVCNNCGNADEWANGIDLCAKCGGIFTSTDLIMHRKPGEDTGGGSIGSYPVHDTIVSEDPSVLESSKSVASLEDGSERRAPDAGGFAPLIRASVVQALSQDEELLELFQTISKEHSPFTIYKEFPSVLENYASRLSESPMRHLTYDIVTLIRNESGSLSRSIILLVLQSLPDQTAFNLLQYESQTHTGDIKGKEGGITQSEAAVNDDVRTRTKDFLCQGAPIKILRQELASLIMSSSEGRGIPQAEGSQTTTIETYDIPHYLENLPSLIDYITGRFSFLFSEPPITDGDIRLRWTCACGMKLFDDFKDTNPHLFGQLEQNVLRTQGLSAYQGAVNNTVQAIKDVVHVVFDGLGRLRHNLTKARISLRRNGPNAGSSANAPVQAGQVSLGPYCRRHVLLCIDKTSTMTTLFQERLSSISTDRQLLEFLRTKYYQYRSKRSWFTLRNLKRVSLSKFAVDHSNLVDVHYHPEACTFDCVCLPPKQSISVEYECEPAPANRPPIRCPAIGPKYLTHLLLHPGMIDEVQKGVLKQLPKLVKGPLVASASESVVGWGLHFEEGLHMETIFCVMAVIVVFSMVFSIVWAVRKTDIQGAFAISGFMVTTGALGVGYLALREA